MSINLEPDVLVYLACGIILAFLALIGALAMAARALKTASQANGKLSDTLMTLNNELSEHSKDRRAWQAERRTAEEERLKMIQRFNEREEELTGKIERLTTKVVELGGKLKLAEDARETMQRELDAANATILGLSKEIECLHTGNNNAREQIAVLQGKVTAYEDTIRRMEAEIQRLQHDLAEAQRAKVEAETKLEQERQAMQNQLDAISTKLESSPAVISTAEPIVNQPSHDGTTERTKDHE